MTVDYSVEKKVEAWVVKSAASTVDEKAASWVVYSADSLADWWVFLSAGQMVEKLVDS